MGPVLKSSVDVAREKGWKQVLPAVGTHNLIFCAVVFPVICLGLIARIPYRQQHHRSAFSDSFNHCNSNGSFSPEPAPTFSLWDRSGFFMITLFWGELSFTKAKVVDVMWDVIVGRGGQALLAWIAFKVFTKALLRSMEMDPVTYRTFEALAFAPPSLEQTVRLLADMTTNKGIRARLVVVWIAIASIFVLAFPTLLSALSGYNTNVQAYVMDKQQIYIPWRDYIQVQFWLNDGWRVGETGRFPVPDNPESMGACKTRGPHLFNYTRNMATQQVEARPIRDPQKAWELVSGNCTLYWRTIEYAYHYGFNGLNNTSSVFRYNGTHELAAPALNITTSYAASNFTLLAYYFEGFPDGDMSVLEGVVDEPSLVHWIYDNETYGLPWVLSQGDCLPLRTHNWGFSFLLLFVVTLMTMIWSIGMYILWVDAYLFSRFDHQGRSMGTYRSSYDFAEAMRKDMGHDSRGVMEYMSDKEIRDQVHKGWNGDRVAYRLRDQSLPQSRWEDFKLWWELQKSKHTGDRVSRRPTSSVVEQEKGLLSPKSPSQVSSMPTRSNRLVVTG